MGDNPGVEDVRPDARTAAELDLESCRESVSRAETEGATDAVEPETPYRFPPSPPGVTSNTGRSAGHLESSMHAEAEGVTVAAEPETPYRFPPSPPSGPCNPGGSWSSGSFSRASFEGHLAALCSSDPLFEFPPAWDDAVLIPCGPASVDATRDERESSVPEPLLDWSRGESSVGGVCIGGALSDLSVTAGRQAGLDTSAAGVGASDCAPSIAGTAKAVSHLEKADDALGSFVGGLVKQDVARFGGVDLGLKLFLGRPTLQKVCWILTARGIP